MHIMRADEGKIAFSGQEEKLKILCRFVHIGIGHFFFNMLMQVKFCSFGKYLQKQAFRSLSASFWRWNRKVGWEASRC